MVTREVQGCRMVPPSWRADVATKLVSMQKCEDIGAEVPATTFECPSIPVGTPCDDGFAATVNDVCTDPVAPSCAGDCMAGHTNIRRYSVHWYKTENDDIVAGPRWRAPADGVPLSGQQAEDACAASGSRLCSYVELCPSGAGHLPTQLPETFTDWVPFRDDAAYGGRRWVSTSSCSIHEVQYCSNSGSECCNHGWCTQPGADDCQARAVEANNFTTSCKGTYACCAVSGAGPALDSSDGQGTNSSHLSQTLQGKWFQTEALAMAFFLEKALRWPARLYDDDGSILRQSRSGVGSLTPQQWDDMDRWRSPCAPCEPGFYKDNEGAGKCKACPLGSSSLNPAAHALADCECLPGFEPKVYPAIDCCWTIVARTASDDGLFVAMSHDATKCADSGNDCCASPTWGEPQTCRDGYMAISTPPEMCLSSSTECSTYMEGIGCYGCFSNDFIVELLAIVDCEDFANISNLDPNTRLKGKTKVFLLWHLLLC